MTATFPAGGVGSAWSRGRLGFVLRRARFRRQSAVRRRRANTQAVTLADCGETTKGTSKLQRYYAALASGQFIFVLISLKVLLITRNVKVAVLCNTFLILFSTLEILQILSLCKVYFFHRRHTVSPSRNVKINTIILKCRFLQISRRLPTKSLIFCLPAV